jgi:hypothetical protein
VVNSQRGDSNVNTKRWTASCAALVLVLAACGDDDEDDTSPDGTTAVTVPAGAGTDSVPQATTGASTTMPMDMTSTPTTSAP